MPIYQERFRTLKSMPGIHHLEELREMHHTCAINRYFEYVVLRATPADQVVTENNHYQVHPYRLPVVHQLLLHQVVSIRMDHNSRRDPRTYIYQRPWIHTDSRWSPEPRLSVWRWNRGSCSFFPLEP